MSFNFLHYFNLFKNLPRYAKRIIAIFSDAFLCVFALWIAFYLRIGEFINLSTIQENAQNIIIVAILSIIIAIPIFWLFGLYRTLFRYSGKSAVINIGLASLIYSLAYFSVITIYSFKGVPRTLGIIQPLVLFFLVCGSRLFVRYALQYDSLYNNDKLLLPKALIYGAGNAGRQLASALENNSGMKVLGFIDDDISLHGQMLQGKDIFSPTDLKNLIKSKKITHVLLALPSINRRKRIQILDNIKLNKVIVRTLPSVTDLVEGKVSTSDIKDLDMLDLLGRDLVLPNKNLLTKNISSKIVLITGAGGSIGSELCRQIIKFQPKKILLLDISEYFLYQIHSELQDIKIKQNLDKELEIIPFLASVQNETRLNEILRKYKPNTLYHAAAYKHVPLVEENVCEGIKNNVLGTLKIAKIAISEGVSNFVLISSDKAVRPTSVMGASKRLSEICLQALQSQTKNNPIKLSMVRFGNVLDSSGSIIPKFKKQIKNGGPVTLTHPDVTRYFMTIPEAAQLVIQAGAMATGSDVFVLEMGEPIKIKELIKRIVNLSGLSIQDENNLDGDIDIKIIGLRPGEKLHEELMLGEDPQPTIHPKIKKAKDPFITWDKLKPEIDKLNNLIDDCKTKEVLALLEKLVSGYKSGKIVDRVYRDQ